MSDLEVTLLAFRDELQKVAFTFSAYPRVSGALSGAGALAGIGTAVGGVGGAFRGYHKARQEGADPTAAALSALPDAGKGALLGAGAGTLLGAGAGSKFHGMGERLAKLPFLGTAAQAGQAQVHGLTSWQPSRAAGGLGGIGANLSGAADSTAEAAEKAFHEAVSRAGNASMIDQAKMTSVPGFINALRHDPTGTLGLAAKHTWEGTSPVGKALTLGLPLYELGSAATEDEDPTHPSRAEHIGRALLPAMGGMVTGHMPFTTQMGVGMALSAAGAGAGHLVDKKRQRPIKAMYPAPYREETGHPTETRVGPGLMDGPMGGGGGMSESYS